MFWPARRSKLLPFGGRPDARIVSDLARRLNSALDSALGSDLFGHDDQVIEMDDAACQLWVEEYEGLTAGRPGMLGEVTARGAPYVRRLAMVYTLLDRATTTGIEHLEAALDGWRYAEASAAFIFGGKTGDALA